METKVKVPIKKETTSVAMPKKGFNIFLFLEEKKRKSKTNKPTRRLLIVNKKGGFVKWAQINPNTKQPVILIKGKSNTFIIIKVLKKGIPTNNYFSFLEHVLIPKGTYRGQKLIKLVTANTIAMPKRTIPNVPEMIPIKYKTATIAAKTNRSNLSRLPIFFFIINRI